MPDIFNLSDPFAQKRLHLYFLRNKIKTDLSLHSSIVKSLSDTQSPMARILLYDESYEYNYYFSVKYCKMCSIILWYRYTMH